MNHEKPLIELIDVKKEFRFDSLDELVLKGIFLKIYEGEFVAIMGSSGSGKTTLMNIIGCLDKPSSGKYLYEGKDITSLTDDERAELRCNAFGFIFQRYNLLSKSTALENVEIPAIYAGIHHSERKNRAEDLLKTFGLEHRLNYFPRQLSGGEQQRIAVSRALMNGGKVILADEPTGALDSKSGDVVLKNLKNIHDKGHTIIMVTHSQEVANAAQRIIHIKDGLITDDSGFKRETEAFKSESLKITRPKVDVEAIIEACKMAWRSLLSNGYRTLLTMLGIIIGVSSVVTMLALGNGAKRAVLERIKAIGTNLVVIRSGAPGIRGSFGGTTLTIDDAKAVGELAHVEYSVPEITKQATVRYGENAYITNVVGATADFPKAHDWEAKYGSFFNETDFNSYSPVAVLGQTIIKNIFPDDPNPVGKFFLIGNVPFLIIGVMEAKGASIYGSDQDDTIWVPITTGRARIYGGQPVAGQIFIKVDDAGAINKVVSDTTSLMLQRHKNLDFNVRNMQSLLETATETQNTLTFFLGSVALIALIVGGIGVMNIMLVSVTERIREIGIRMATGARSFDVLLQFLTEAVVICSIGGIIGVILGLALAFLARSLGMAVEFSLLPIVLSFACSFLTGLLFGYLPAKKAAELDPVVALSME